MPANTVYICVGSVSVEVYIAPEADCSLTGYNRLPYVAESLYYVEINYANYVRT